MKNRIKHKMIKKKIKNILKEFEKYFTIKKDSLWITTNYFDGRCHFEILEEPRIKIGFMNVSLENNEPYFYMQPKYTYLRFHPIDCKDENTSHNIKEFIIRVKQAINDFEEVMRFEDESVEELLETFEQAKESKKRDMLFSGFEREEYYDLKTKINDYIKNKVDFNKIPKIILKLDNDYFRSMGSIFFYPNWKECDDEYLDKFEDDIFNLQLSSFQWRKIRTRMPKRQKKIWMVYTKNKSTSLFKYKNREL